MRLHTKLALVVVSSVITTIVLLIILLFVFSNTFIQGYDHVDLQNISQEIEKNLQQAGELNQEAISSIFQNAISKYKGVEMELFEENGQILFSSTGRTQSFSFEEIAERFVDQPMNLFTGKDVHLLYDLELENKRHFLQLSVAGEDLLDVQIYLYFNHYSSIPFLILPIVLIILMPTLAVIIFFIRVNRRIKKLNTAIQKADLNHLSIPVIDDGKDEIGQLSQLFNAMSKKLANQFQHIKQIEKARKTLISNLSHDLQTPLTSIKGYAETINRSKSLSEFELHKYSTIIVQRSEYMEHLLKQLFEIALLNRMPTSFKKNSCNMSKIVQQIIMDYVNILEVKNIQADISIPSTAIWVNMDERDVHQVVRNLVENAIQYGEEGKYLGIYLQESEKDVQLKIIDKGKGIPQEEQKRIFEQFYRIDKGRKSDGLGVGLAIAKEIVERHNGKITVESNPYVSTVFTIKLPCFRPV